MEDALEVLKQRLEKSWNETDSRLFNECQKFCDEHKDERFDIHWGYPVMAFTKFTHSLNKHERDACHYGPSWFKSENANQAKKFCNELQRKVLNIVGKILNWEQRDSSNSLYSYIVTGINGKCLVRQIFAGGYNIVRLHIRNIIKKMN